MSCMKVITNNIIPQNSCYFDIKIQCGIWMLIRTMISKSCPGCFGLEPKRTEPNRKFRFVLLWFVLQSVCFWFGSLLNGLVWFEFFLKKSNRIEPNQSMHRPSLNKDELNILMARFLNLIMIY